jgi:hypothetical protein
VAKEQRSFAEKVIAELRRRGVADAIDYDEGGFCLALGSGKSLQLANAFAEWRRAPRLRRGAVLRRCVDGFEEIALELPNSVDHARPNLLPRVRDLQFYAVAEYRLETAGETSGWLSYRALNDQLAVEIIYDHPNSVASVHPERLESWGLSFDDALRTARANLRERTTGTFTQQGHGVFVSRWHDAYDSSRLLLTELISRLEVHGDPVALLPHRDHLIITGSDDANGLRQAAELAEPLLANERRETGYAFALVDGAWVEYMPPPGHPARTAFANLAKITQFLDYEDQKHAMIERLEKEGKADAIFVAGAVLKKHPATGEFWLASSWSAGVPTLLPHGDRIAFVRGPGTAAPRVDFVPWDEAVRHVGGLMKAQGLRPEVWFVDSFPDAETMARLEALAIPAGGQPG